MLQFNLWQSQANKNWYFNMQAANGEKVAQSEGYTSRQSALNTINLIRREAANAPINEHQNGRWVRLAA